MTPSRCAWCGEPLDIAPGQPSFCDTACRHAHEEWCAARTARMAQAVARWRDMPRWRDMQRGAVRGGRSTPASAVRSGPPSTGQDLAAGR